MADWIGQTIGKVRIETYLARGGMAEVWEAKSFGAHGFEKTLVIKRILPALAAREQFVDLFVHEAKLAVRLSHTNIVQVFDLGRADGVPPSYFIAMEYVPGNIWPYQKLPPNPTAWLYTVAKNKLKNHIIQRNKISKNKPEPSVSEDPFEQIEIDFSEQHIVDSQLRMLLVICDPCISNEMQICLALRILGGLGLDEIADAFLTNKETIHKRLQRAKEKLREKKISCEVPPAKNISKRLDAVLQTIYLLFSEGYYSERHNHIVRKELCIEALNLAYLLLQNPVTDLHDTNALMALMCFQSSRLEARKSLEYPLMLFDHQDINLWDQEFIEKGNFYLQQASKWPTLSPYYLEASIAYWHTVKNEYPEKWLNILNLYDHLLLIQNSPVAALNRLLAYSKVNGSIY